MMPRDRDGAVAPEWGTPATSVINLAGFLQLANSDVSSLLSPCGREESVQNLLWLWMDLANFSRRRIEFQRSRASHFDRQLQDLRHSEGLSKLFRAT